MNVLNQLNKFLFPVKYGQGNDKQWVERTASGLGGSSENFKISDPQGYAKLDQQWQQDNPGKQNPYPAPSGYLLPSHLNASNPKQTTPAPAAVAAKLMPSPMKAVLVSAQTTVTPGTKKVEMVHPDLFDAAEKVSQAYGIPKEMILANTRWEHRNNSNWNKGIYGNNVWWDPGRQTGEASYGPYQINMRYYGPDAVKLGRITPDNPLYITPEDASDPWKSTEWEAKKFSQQVKNFQKKNLPVDWEAILQSYNSHETNRGKNVLNLISNTDFQKGQ